MAYPPVLPPTGRTNSTPQVDAHPSDHNTIAAALAAMPWGRVASAVNSGAAQTGIAATPTDLTGLSLTFTRIAGRVYHAMLSLTLQAVGVQATANVTVADGANAVQHNPAVAIPANLYMQLTSLYVIPAGTGPLTLKLRGSIAGGTLSVLNGAANASSFVVYDVGPV
jgi:hypothetical protein